DFGLRGGLDPEEDGVAVYTVEAFEGGAGGGARVEGRLEVVRHGCGCLRRVRGVPPAVGAGGFDLAEAGGSHPALGEEPIDMLAVDAGPEATRAAASKALQPGVAVVAPLLTVDPPVSERGVECFGVGDGPKGCGLLGELQPDATRLLPMFFEPGFPLVGSVKAQDGETVRAGRGVRAHLDLGVGDFMAGREGGLRLPVLVAGRATTMSGDSPRNPAYSSTAGSIRRRSARMRRVKGRSSTTTERLVRVRFQVPTTWPSRMIEASRRPPPAFTRFTCSAASTALLSL